jgi:citrate lyase beta subunit
MSINQTYARLGASLYVPAIHKDVLAIANGEKIPFLRSCIICTEDAIAEHQVDDALNQLRTLLRQFEPTPMLRFIRARNPEVLGRLLDIEGIENIDGFVLPKVTTDNLIAYMSSFRRDDRFYVMPTLETRDTLSQDAMLTMRDLLLADSLKDRVLCLRIGGNDLLQLLGTRRSTELTAYETGLGYTIDMLVSTFKPYGFNLSSPVFEGFDHAEVLAREVQMDKLRGLFAKTAIHPDQIPAIERHYKVDQAELEQARKILCEDAPAVFGGKDDAVMCEVATHRAWAENILTRADIYGTRPGHKEAQPGARHDQEESVQA